MQWHWGNIGSAAAGLAALIAAIFAVTYGSRAGGGSPNGPELTTFAAHYRRPQGSGRIGAHAPGAAATGAAILLTESASAVVLQSRAFTSPESAASK